MWRIQFKSTRTAATTETKLMELLIFLTIPRNSHFYATRGKFHAMHWEHGQKLFSFLFIRNKYKITNLVELSLLASRT